MSDVDFHVNSKLSKLVYSIPQRLKNKYMD